MKFLFYIILLQFIFLFFIPIRAQKIEGDLKEYGNDAKHGKFISSRGFKMYYEMYGAGKPVLFIPGNGGSFKDFEFQIPYFSKHFQVIVADSRAQGKSIDFKDSLSFDMMADDYESLLDSLHLDSCFIVGWSDGGINALLLTLRHPKKVKKLVIVGANLWPDTTAIKPFLYNAMKGEYDSKPKVNMTEEEKNIHKLKVLDYLHPHISLEELNNIKCPTLVISGDHDIIQLMHTVAIAQNIPKYYLWIIPNTGHSAPISRHNNFNTEVLSFFDKPYHAIEGFDSFKK